MEEWLVRVETAGNLFQSGAVTQAEEILVALRQSKDCPSVCMHVLQHSSVQAARFQCAVMLKDFALRNWLQLSPQEKEHLHHFAMEAMFALDDELLIKQIAALLGTTCLFGWLEWQKDLKDAIIMKCATRHNDRAPIASTAILQSFSQSLESSVVQSARNIFIRDQSFLKIIQGAVQQLIDSDEAHWQDSVSQAVGLRSCSCLLAAAHWDGPRPPRMELLSLLCDPSNFMRLLRAALAHGCHDAQEVLRVLFSVTSFRILKLGQRLQFLEQVWPAMVESYALMQHHYCHNYQPQLQAHNLGGSSVHVQWEWILGWSPAENARLAFASWMHLFASALTLGALIDPLREQPIVPTLIAQGYETVFQPALQCLGQYVGREEAITDACEAWAAGMTAYLTCCQQSEWDVSLYQGVSSLPTFFFQIYLGQRLQRAWKEDQGGSGTADSDGEDDSDDEEDEEAVATGMEGMSGMGLRGVECPHGMGGFSPTSVEEHLQTLAALWRVTWPGHWNVAMSVLLSAGWGEAAAAAVVASPLSPNGGTSWQAVSATLPMMLSSPSAAAQGGQPNYPSPEVAVELCQWSCALISDGWLADCPNSAPEALTLPRAHIPEAARHCRLAVAQLLLRLTMGPCESSPRLLAHLLLAWTRVIAGWWLHEQAAGDVWMDASLWELLLGRMEAIAVVWIGSGPAERAMAQLVLTMVLRMNDAGLPVEGLQERLAPLCLLSGTGIVVDRKSRLWMGEALCRGQNAMNFSPTWVRPLLQVWSDALQASLTHQFEQQIAERLRLSLWTLQGMAVVASPEATAFFLHQVPWASLPRLLGLTLRIGQDIPTSVSLLAFASSLTSHYLHRLPESEIAFALSTSAQCARDCGEELTRMTSQASRLEMQEASLLNIIEGMLALLKVVSSQRWLHLPNSPEFTASEAGTVCDTGLKEAIYAVAQVMLPRMTVAHCAEMFAVIIENTVQGIGAAFFDGSPGCLAAFSSLQHAAELRSGPAAEASLSAADILFSNMASCQPEMRAKLAQEPVVVALASSIWNLVLLGSIHANCMESATNAIFALYTAIPEAVILLANQTVEATTTSPHILMHASSMLMPAAVQGIGQVLSEELPRARNAERTRRQNLKKALMHARAVAFRW
jgi:hypothetical protein